MIEGIEKYIKETSTECSVHWIPIYDGLYGGCICCLAKIPRKAILIERGILPVNKPVGDEYKCQ